MDTGRHGGSGEKQVDSGMTRLGRLNVECERGVKNDSGAKQQKMEGMFSGMERTVRTGALWVPKTKIQLSVLISFIQ